MFNYHITLQLHLSWKNEDLCSHKSQCMNIYGSFMHITQRLQRSQVSFNGGMLKQTLYSMEYSSALTMNELLIHVTILFGWIPKEICVKKSFHGSYKFCPEGIQPLNMKNRDIY